MTKIFQNFLDRVKILRLTFSPYYEGDTEPNPMRTSQCKIVCVCERVLASDLKNICYDKLCEKFG